MALLTVLVVMLRQNKPQSSGTPALPKMLHLIWFTVFTGQSAVALTNYHCEVIVCSEGLCSHDMTTKTINTATDGTLGHVFGLLYSSLLWQCLLLRRCMCLTSTPSSHGLQHARRWNHRHLYLCPLLHKHSHLYQASVDFPPEHNFWHSLFKVIILITILKHNKKKK